MLEANSKKYDYHRISFPIKQDRILAFKKLCKQNHSDMTKELNKFINAYISKHLKT